MSQNGTPTTAAAMISFPLPSLEGKEIRTDGQKIMPAGPPKAMPGKSGFFYHFTALGSARATITNAYSIEELRSLTIASSKTKAGEEISGRKISSFARDFNDIAQGGEARSGKHPRRFIELFDGAAAVVIETSFGMTLPSDPRKVLQVSEECKPSSPPEG